MLSYLTSKLTASDGPSSFHSYLSRGRHGAQQHLQGPAALQLPEVLLQVLCHLDAGTLLTTVPLVCKHWKQEAASPQIWASRIDQHVLKLLAVPATVTDAASAVASGPADSSNPSPVSTGPGLQAVLSAARTSSRASAANDSLALPLLYHALYGTNLLRNPMFRASCNSEYRKLVRLRPGTSYFGLGGSGSGTPPAVVSSQQRRLAWVASVGQFGPQGLSWEWPPSGLPAGASPPPPPLPYPYPASVCAPALAALGSSISGASAGLPQQLQGWLRSLKVVPAPAAPAPVAASSSSSSLAAAATAAVRAGSGPDQGPALDVAESTGAAAAATCLSTAGSWGEVVQVIDLLEELTQRGISADLAAALLDAGGLALGLSVWVAAPAPPEQAPKQAGEPAATADPDAAWSGYTAATAVNAAASQRTHQQHQQHQQSQPQQEPQQQGALGSQPQFAAALMLDDGQVPLRSFQTFVRRESSHHFFSKRLAVPPGGWHRYAYLLPGCPPGCRRAVVLLRGRGPQATGARGSGVKFAAAQLAFVPQEAAVAFGAEECLEAWQGRQVQGLQ